MDHLLSRFVLERKADGDGLEAFGLGLGVSWGPTYFDFNDMADLLQAVSVSLRMGEPPLFEG